MRTKKTTLMFAIAVLMALTTNVFAESTIIVRAELIQEEVMSLGYSEEIAHGFVLMASQWKGAKSPPDANSPSEITAISLHGVISNNVLPKKDHFGLAKIVETGKANCLGYAQIFYILGRSIGLKVWVISFSSENIGNVVELSDNKFLIMISREKDCPSKYFIVNGSMADIKSDFRVFNKKELVSLIQFCQGTLFYLSGNTTESIGHFNRAIELDPNNVPALNNRAGARLILQEHIGAMLDLNKAISLDPNYANAYQNRANTYLDLKRYSEAIADYNKIISFKPDFAKAYLGRSVAYSFLGQKKKAEADYKKAIELNPKLTRVQLNAKI